MPIRHPRRSRFARFASFRPAAPRAPCPARHRADHRTAPRGVREHSSRRAGRHGCPDRRRGIRIPAHARQLRHRGHVAAPPTGRHHQVVDARDAAGARSAGPLIGTAFATARCPRSTPPPPSRIPVALRQGAGAGGDARARARLRLRRLGVQLLGRRRGRPRDAAELGIATLRLPRRLQGRGLHAGPARRSTRSSARSARSAPSSACRSRGRPLAAQQAVARRDRADHRGLDRALVQLGRRHPVRRGGHRRAADDHGRGRARPTSSPTCTTPGRRPAGSRSSPPTPT